MQKTPRRIYLSVRGAFSRAGKRDNKVILLVKGVNYLEGAAFTVDRDARTIAWTAAQANGDFDICSDWVNRVAAIYKERIGEDEDWGEELFDPACVERYKDDTEMIRAPKLNTKNITAMQEMFDGCKKLVSIPKYDTSNVTYMTGMFARCLALEAIPQIDTSKATDMNSMFQECTSLKAVPKLDTSNVTLMSHMFWGCTALKAVPKLDTSNVIYMTSMFQNCTALKAVPKLDTSNVILMGHMFWGCTALETITQLDMSKTTDTNQMFYGCVSLKNISFVPNSIITSIELKQASQLSKESLLSILNGLNDSVVDKKIFLHADSKALLSADELAIAASKGWTIY